MRPNKAMKVMIRYPDASCRGWPNLSILASAAFLLIAIASAGACRFDGSGLGPSDGGPDSAMAADMDNRDLATILPPDFILTPDLSSAGALPFKVSNVQSIPLAFNNGTLNLSGEAVLDTTAATLKGPTGSILPQAGVGLYTPDDKRYVVLSTGSLNIPRGGTLRVVGRRPLVVLASKEVIIEGLLDASGDRQAPGPGGGRGGDKEKQGQAGMHSSCQGGQPGKAKGFPNLTDATGAAGGSFGGVGGRGGDGPQGAPACAPQQLVPLVGGSGGGGGAGQGGTGGGGGGAIQISAALAIEITATGAIHAGGGGGCRGDVKVAKRPGSGGGGGSGGAILLEAPKVTINGRLAANGGGGGGGVFHLTSAGKDGEDAKLKGVAHGGKGGEICCNSPAGHGGAGSFDARHEGLKGTFAAGHGGGGGGGAGAIHIATAYDQIKGTPAGISPPATTDKLTPLASTDGDSAADAGRD